MLQVFMEFPLELNLRPIWSILPVNCSAKLVSSFLQLSGKAALFHFPFIAAKFGPVRVLYPLKKVLNASSRKV